MPQTLDGPDLVVSWSVRMLVLGELLYRRSLRQYLTAEPLIEAMATQFLYSIQNGLA